MADINDHKTDQNQTDMTLEESFVRLDELLNEMESQGLSLEDSFKLYEQGMKLVREMKERLNDLSGRIEKISADGRIEEFGDEF